MKLMGLIGGLSPESTQLYYQGINAGVRARLGGLHSARILLSSVDFGTFVALKAADDWDSQGDILVREAERLAKAGADFLVLATNTMHQFAGRIEAAVDIPLLHLADATAAVIRAAGLRSVGLLGTRYTMEFDFYKQRLEAQGITPLVPDFADREEVNRIIYDELCAGQIKPESRDRYRQVMARLVAEGAEAVILGCTEITTLVEERDAAVPLFDTTAIHIEQAVEALFET